MTVAGYKLKLQEAAVYPNKSTLTCWICRKKDTEKLGERVDAINPCDFLYLLLLVLIFLLCFMLCDLYVANISGVEGPKTYFCSSWRVQADLKHRLWSLLRQGL